MAEARNEHRVVDRGRDRIAPSGQQRRGDRAVVAVERGADARVDRVAQALHDGGIAQPQTAGIRRHRGRDRAHHEAGRADALEEHVAGEIIAAGPQRRERRHQPRLQLHEAADLGRGPLAHRQAHALELDVAALCLHRGDAQHETVGALADVAGLDEARQRDGIQRLRQHRMRDTCRVPGRHGKAARDRSYDDGGRKQGAPPQQTSANRESESDGGRGDNPELRLVIGRKVERNAAAERHRHPRQQASGASLGAAPFAQPLDDRRPEAETRRRKAAGRRGSADGPSPRDTLRPNGPTRLRHSLHPAIRDSGRGYRNVQAAE